jgi:hypothetical protein
VSAGFHRVVAALGDRVTTRRGGNVMAKCPAHEDREASLSVGGGDKGALGLTMADLFDEPKRGRGRLPSGATPQHCNTPRAARWPATHRRSGCRSRSCAHWGCWTSRTTTCRPFASPTAASTARSGARGSGWRSRRVRTAISGSRGRGDPRSACNQVDHVVPHRGDQRLFWDAARNWQSLCRSCGAAKSRAGL